MFMHPCTTVIVDSSTEGNLCSTVVVAAIKNCIHLKCELFEYVCLIGRTLSKFSGLLFVSCHLLFCVVARQMSHSFSLILL